MNSHSNVDCGNLGNIVVLLNGKLSLEKRIGFSKNIFFSSSNVPPQHKEEVVIIWLTDILSTNKVLTLSSKEVKLVWKTLGELLSSRRLKALCSQHWVCPLTAAFIQTLVIATCGSDDGTSRDIQEEALLISYTLFQLPSLSPQVALLTKQTLRIFASLLSLTCEGYRPPSLVSQLSLLLQKSSFILNCEFKKHNSLCLIYEKLGLPLLEVLFIFKDDRNEDATELVSEIETFLFSTILSKEEGHSYLSVLDFPLQRESVESLSTFGESVFAFLRSLIGGKEDKCEASYFLRDFCGCFFRVFRTVDVVPYQFIIIIMNLLGVSLEGGPSVQKDNLSSRSLLPIQLFKLDRDRFIAAVLESLLANNVDLSLTVSDVTLKKWLENLGEYLANEGDINVETLTCLKIIVCADPLSSSKSRFLCHLLVVDRTNTKMTELLDEVLCEILNIHVKLRTVDIFYNDLCETLLTVCKKNASISLLTEQRDLTYRNSRLLPHKFFAKFLISIKEMGSQMWIKTWHSIHKVISESCRESLKNDSSPASVSCVAYTIWLSSCCLSASSVTETASLSGLPTKIARLMNSVAHEGIIPLVNEMMKLTIESSLLCCSLLRFILVWTELHSTLISISTEYRNQSDYLFELENDCAVPKNLSPVVPFIKPSSWKEIFALLNEEEDSERALIIQLMIQKLSVLKIHRSEVQILKSASIDFSIMNILNYVLKIKDPSMYPMTTDIIALHLPSLLPHMKKFHFDAVSRCLISGISEGRDSWIQFSQSSFFKSSELLQSRCFGLICEKFLALLSGRKRKLDDEEAASVCLHPYPLSQKLIVSLMALQEGSRSQVELEKDLAAILVNVETLLMARNETCKFLTTREEGQVTNMLQIVDSFPISFLRPKLLLSVLAFALIITLEEGGFMGRKAITLLLLRILNKVFVASNSHYIFKLSKRKPYSTLLWLQRECQAVLKTISVEECHLQVMVEHGDNRMTNSSDTLEALLVAMSRLTNAFVIWNENGAEIKSYLEEIVSFVSLEESKDAGYLASAFLVHSLRESLTPCISPYLIKSCEVLSSWCWKVVEKMDLSKITKVPIAWVLMTFSFLLQTKLSLNNNHRRSPSDKESSDAQSNVKKRVELDIMDWNLLSKHGIQLAEIAVATEDSSLRTFALEFYTNVLSSTKLMKNINEWEVAQKIWSLMFLLDDSSMYMENVVSVLSPRQFKTVKKVLLEEIQFGKVESSKLLKWLSAFSSCIGTSQTLQIIKSKFFEQLIGILCIRFSCPIAAQASCYHSLYVLFISILQSEKNLSHQCRSVMLGMISQCSFTHLSYDDFFKTFQLSTKLLLILLSSEHPFLPNRSSCFLSAVMTLIAHLLEKTDIDKGALLSQRQLREVEKCCTEIEIVVKNLKCSDRSFFKISSFTLAAVLEKMHRTKMLPSVKISMERIVFNLLDLSDPYSLRHLLVTLSPSVTAVLKHFYSTFNSKFKYDPRNA